MTVTPQARAVAAGGGSAGVACAGNGSATDEIPVTEIMQVG